MTINRNIRGEKLQCEINREAAKSSALLLGRVGKYEYLTSEKILRSGPSQIIQQAKACCII